MSDVITVTAPAKVNLFLRVLAREESGYHGLETLFCRVALSDRLTAERREGESVTLTVEGADLGPADENLAVRAAAMVLAALRTPFGVHLTLDKRIPVGAGLGGGSSDAAAALLAVNRLAGHAVPSHELLQFAARLGADVAFPLSGASLALAWGHGERLLVLPPLPNAPALLLSPRIPVATPEAYRWLDESRPAHGRRGPVALDLDALSSWGSIARMAGNDFESVVFGRHAEIRAAYEAVAGTRPLLCRMTGSGSTVFGVYRTARDRDDAALMLGKKHGTVIVTETA
jgi:4-diphosphocytidyl-2-C-methyl-D-erythritol kinase